MKLVDVGPDLLPIVSDEELVCECGVPLDVHPPLPPPGPLNRWRAEHSGSPDLTWQGKPRDTPLEPVPAELTARRTATMRGQAAVAYRNRNR